MCVLSVVARSRAAILFVQSNRDAIVSPPGGVRSLITFERLSIAMTVGVKLSAP
jgi:hypothetical protein